MSGMIKLNIEGLLPLKKQLELVAMPRALRRRLLSRTARKVISDSKKRVRQQVDLKGRAFVIRKKKRKGGRKMLSRLARRLKVISNSGTEAKIGFFRAIDARIAAKQQYGSVEHLSAAQLKSKDKGSRSQSASRRQAIALREAGFEIKKAKGRGKKSPSLKWITQNMNQGQAGVALRYLREANGETIKKSWTTVLPARSFLGASVADVSTHVKTIMKQMKQEITHVAR